MRNRFLFFSLIFCACLFLTSCVVANLTKHQENICEVHDNKMKKRLNTTHFGKQKFRPIDFPNHGGSVGMGCIKGPWPEYRLAWHYVCKDCTKKYKAFKKEYKDEYGF